MTIHPCWVRSGWKGFNAKGGSNMHSNHTNHMVSVSSSWLEQGMLLSL